MRIETFALMSRSLIFPSVINSPDPVVSYLNHNGHGFLTEQFITLLVLRPILIQD
jgi:hypothetical protein